MTIEFIRKIDGSIIISEVQQTEDDMDNKFVPGVEWREQVLPQISNEVWEWIAQASTLGELNARFTKLMNTLLNRTSWLMSRSSR
jgi:hypothetical protein